MSSEEMGYEDINLDMLDEMPEEDYSEGEEDPVLASLTPEEKQLLAKIQQKQMEQDYVIQIFNELENKPSEEEIALLKQQVGDVYLISLSEKENFLFRPLKRLEWRSLMQKIQKLDDMKKAEAVVMKGCLFPKMDQQNINVLTAGAIETLRDMILQASNFMSPEVAMQLVRKL